MLFIFYIYSYSITVVFKIQVLRVLIKNLNLSFNHILPIPYMVVNFKMSFLMKVMIPS